VADLGDPRLLAASSRGEGGRDASFANGDPGASAGSGSDGGAPRTGAPNHGGHAQEMQTPSCWATCVTPAGAFEYAASLSQVYEELAGRWFLCSGMDQLYNTLDAPTDVVGLEFGSPPDDDGCSFAGGSLGCGGPLYYLVDGPSGSVHGPGVRYELTYEVVQEGQGVFRIIINPTPDRASLWSFRYSPCPRELALYSMDSPQPATLVGFGSSDNGLEGGGCAAAGPGQSPDTIDRAKSAVLGAWRICTGLDNVRALTSANDIVGMEFGPAAPGGGYCGDSSSCQGGDLHYLVEGASGPVRGEGSAYLAKYELAESVAGLALTLSDPRSAWTTPILYTSAPRELSITTSLGADGGATMTALP
jgi:hypothetical protein